MTLDALLELPFEQYIAGCWQHVARKALADPVCAIVYGHMIAAPSAIEAQWAKRYWYHQCGATSTV